MIVRRHRGWATLGVAAALVAAVAASGCAMDASGDDDDTSDGGVSGCEMLISISPESPEAPAEILVDGATDSGSLYGVEEYAFSVTHGDAAVGFEERDPYDGSKIRFTAEQPGTYQIVLVGSVGGTDCVDGMEVLNVLDGGADNQTYRLRFFPAAGQPAPVQEQVITVPGGVADYSLGVLGLGNGLVASGSVIDGGSAPVPGYVRITVAGSPEQVVETFADAGGSYSARVGGASYQALVVPADDAVAPARFESLSAGSAAVLAVTPGDAITGLVLDGTGAPIAGARVSLRIDGVPSTIAVTAADGSFTVRGRAGGATAVTVSPPPGSGLPRVDLGASAGLVAAVDKPLTIRYAAGVTSRDVALTVLEPDGATPAGAARVTWIARPMTAVATVTPQGEAALDASGGLRLTGVADGAGALAADGLPEAVYDVVVETAGGAVGLTSIELEAGVESPASLVTPAPAALGGTAVDDQAAPVAGVTVTAVPRGLLANVAGASATAITSDDGSFTAELVAGGSYDLSISPRDHTLARVRRAELVAPAAGQSLDLGDVALERAISVFGQVTIPGVAGGAAGVTVTALCFDCDPVAAQIPAAEAVTNYNGRFDLAIADPGGGEAR